jgi:hypothetical protein
MALIESAKCILKNDNIFPVDCLLLGLFFLSGMPIFE